MKEINKNSPLPLYYQLKESILKAIKNEEIVVGEKIPSERELAEYHNISRMTVKKAVDILVNNDYLIKKQGRGTFVSNYKESYSISPLSSFTKEMEKKGLNYKNKILDFSKIKDKKIAKKLNFKENDEFFKFERLRLIENKPFLLEKTYLSTKKIANLKQEDLKNNSLFKLIKNKYNIKLKNAEAEIEAVILNDQVAKKMKVKEGMLGLYFEQISRDENDEIIEYTSAYYRNDNYKFKFKFDLE
ncbi:regulatory protein GntR, HTH:UbiC transcription regulator-associated [Halanaerobium saccharolyticum subsp. saccharolyticum DSM 6643]|uniref:Regulatory protein GntR, HTH:UbiC transcription regulator-associated n=1 Tax=Halanaerobium saccharolyticum subsp. saccharolyticum DSM 6643 TaxID=1293054 RepID=M5E2V1_9FIRM|nr:GntR family transcriptional regulator [Halanaerobium saccharolyticum]CCU80516.1 regulatory protein GntR, HTH:UbiC transcription regulator-associated [Halanaerobium saccharolyticum subsp. saccharolyticum DSM 6643]